MRFIILMRLTDVRIPPAPGAETISQSHQVARPRSPIAATAVTPTLPHSKNVRLNLSLLSIPDLPLLHQPVNTPWILRSLVERHWNVFLSLFELFKEAPTYASLVLLQDPPVHKAHLPSFNRFKCFFPPVRKP